MKTNSNFAFRISRFLDERGVALIVVLWIFIFLFVVAVEFASSVREEGGAAQRYSEEAGGYYLALAGFQQGLYDLLPQTPPSGQPALPLWKKIACEGGEREFGGGYYRARLVDEGGKVNLNRADENILSQIFINLGVQGAERSILVDSILDWRDTDKDHRPNGAEDEDYYLKLSPSYTAKNGPFAAVEELLWVKGVTPELFFGQEEEVGLRDIFSVDNPTDRINQATASVAVIRAVLGVSEGDARRFVEERCKAMGEATLADMFKQLGIPGGDAALRRFVLTQPSVITIEAKGYQTESATPRQVKGVVRLVGGQRGFEIVRWIDRDAVRNEE